jgi:NADPH2:quinone reductase
MIIETGISLPATMRAIEITEPGGPEVLRPRERPIPEPAQGEVLIKVAGAGVNRPDCLQRRGMYPPPPGASDIPGLEVAGRVVAVADDVPVDWLGRSVCALVSGGGYAEYCAAPIGQCLPVPKGLDAIHAAAIPETFFTVWYNLFQRAQLKHGETVLIHGGASGIGTTAIQLARAFGARVFCTVGREEKKAACINLGAEHVIDYKEEDFVEVIKELTGNRGVDAILDFIAGDYFPRNIDLLAVDGRLAIIGVMGGSQVSLDCRHLMLKRLTISGSTLRAQSVAAKAAIAEELREHVWPLLDKGRIRPVLSQQIELNDAGEAHRVIESNQLIGKIVLSVP